MEIEFFYDRGIEGSHSREHGISDATIYRFFEMEEYLYFKRKDGSIIGTGYSLTESLAEILIEVVFRRIAKDKFFVITAYEVEDEQRIREIREALDHG
jgi:hypothetical protein